MIKKNLSGLWPGKGAARPERFGHNERKKMRSRY